MNKASPADLRKSLEIANRLALIGVRFVPIPAMSDEDYQALLAVFSRKLDQIAIEAEKHEGGDVCSS